MNNTTHTEPGAVQAAQPYEKYNNMKDLIFQGPYTSKNYIKIIQILDEIDIVRALFILDGAKHLFEMKYEEIVRENAK